MTQYSENWTTNGSGTPTGTTERWNTGTITWTIADNQLNAAYSSSNYQILSLDSADDSDDVDVVLTFKCNNRFLTGTTQRVGIGARCSGASGSKNGYLVYISEANTFNLLKYVSNSPTVIDSSTALTTALGLNNVLDIANRYISIRFNVNSTALKAKIWLTFEESEPGTWDIDTTDSDISTGDWTGIMTFMSSASTSFDIEALHISDVPASAATWNQVNGVIRDENNAVAARDVVLFHRARNEYAGITTSDGGDGTYTVYTPFGGEHIIVAQDDATTGTIYNDKIERVIPS